MRTSHGPEAARRKRRPAKRTAPHECPGDCRHLRRSTRTARRCPPRPRPPRPWPRGAPRAPRWILGSGPLLPPLPPRPPPPPRSRRRRCAAPGGGRRLRGLPRPPLPAAAPPARVREPCGPCARPFSPSASRRERTSLGCQPPRSRSRSPPPPLPPAMATPSAAVWARAPRGRRGTKVAAKAPPRAGPCSTARGAARVPAARLRRRDARQGDPPRPR
mmetsp:Transcript_43565/g.113108  ORF Transcript_43565/g.113108 Transcript_43565/m.113108 type:complete len:217 (+) Transcript_43565:95-745(+)